MPPAANTAVATAIAVVALTCWYRRRNSKTGYKETATAIIEPAPPINSINKSKVDPQVWRSFEEAAHRIRSDKALGRHLSNGDKLMFYGLFKHIVSGDAPAKMGTNGSFNIVVEQAKHAAWAKMRGIPVPMAITHYLAAVQHFVDQQSSSSKDGAVAQDASEGSNDDEYHGAGGAMGAGVQSRPVVDNGGMKDDDGSTVEDQLLRAAGQNNLHALIDLLQHAQGKLDVDYQDESGQTALHLAADKGCVECCIALIEAGADVNAADHDGISVLQAAVIAGNIKICKVLLDNGANADQADEDGDTPRTCAIEDGDEVMQKLFKSASIPTIKEEDEQQSNDT